MTLSRFTALILFVVFCFRTPSSGAEVTHPYRGITLIERIETEPRELRMYIVQIELGAPGIRFRLSPPGGTRDTIRQTTLDFLRQERAQLAINAHFFVPFPATNTTAADVVGLAVSDGVVYSLFEPQPVKKEFEDQSYAIVPFAPALNIERSNHAAFVRRDPRFPDNKHVVRQKSSLFKSRSPALWTSLSGSAQIISNGALTIPAYGPGGLHSTTNYSGTNSWYERHRARSVIGLTRNNSTLVLFVASGTDGTNGMAVSEAARLLRTDYKVWNALNLDGGGSTSLAMADPITGEAQLLNKPGDDGKARAVGSSLAVFAEPVVSRKR